MADRFLSLFKVFREKKKKSPEAAPAQQREKLEQFKPLQDDGALDQTQEEELARGHFHKTLKKFWKSPHIRRRRTSSAEAKDPAKPDLGLTELQAEPDVRPESAECSEDPDTSVTETWAKALLTSVTEDLAITNTENEETQGITNTNTTPTPTMSQELIFNYFKDPSQQQQVPAKVKNIHQSLLSQVTVDAWLHVDIVKLAEEHPADMVLTLLRCAPTCDRAAAMIWRTIGSLGPAVEKVMPALLCVMENWPLHSMCTSDGDDTDVFALAATLGLWVILQVPESHEAMNLYSSRLFVALLFLVVITTQQMPPEEVDNFWRACWKEHRLPSKPNRFAVQAMKALLCRLQWDHVVVAMERKRGWDVMLCARTQHYAMGLLAREMRRVLIPVCSPIALHLLRHLNKEEPRWDLPFLAFLVEVLDCLDLSECSENALQIMTRHLQSKSREMHRVALRGLMVLGKDPAMVRRRQQLELCWELHVREELLQENCLETMEI
uniref:uncharacterized protein n=1 Tax=Lonchura striata TaxID=40157 RepID=UPI0012932F7E|nr:uncharacterized protein LOC116183845 [Lonchura striata domestica]